MILLKFAVGELTSLRVNESATWLTATLLANCPVSLSAHFAKVQLAQQASLALFTCSDRLCTIVYEGNVTIVQSWGKVAS